ncbi:MULTISPECIES: CU044_2847 family protein [Trichocoleus]|uniref:Trypsin-co-occurring domain-containing protein n=1 Tax=Trichocoleus desertorum GB2-A4 TaxID=2933944 RepID=A0ABV0JFF5_9CYAN|nr:CU044_2847 family protein [Trichocoleus sp. FACHB-46]MBD1865024.1 hypothetical protein [Trichocoleus sp. FACHB-46]
MDKEVAQFSLEDGTKFLVEVEEPEAVAVERVAINTGQMVLQARQTFEEAIDAVKPVASVLVTRLRRGMTTPADEVEVKFGLKLTAEAGAIFTSISGDVNFEITLKWKEEKSS